MASMKAFTRSIYRTEIEAGRRVFHLIYLMTLAARLINQPYLLPFLMGKTGVLPLRNRREVTREGR
jgi:hypothetical protein